MESRSDFEPDSELPGMTVPGFLTAAAGGNFEGFVPFQEAEPEPPREIEEPEEDTTDFDDEIGQELIGVINLGKLTRTFHVFGHTFVLRTIKTDEQFAVAKIIEPYQGTIAQGRSYAAACVAASLVSVDGRNPIRGLGPDVQDTLEDRFNYIITKWDDPVIDEVYACYVELVERKRQVYERLRSKSTASRTTSTS